MTRINDQAIKAFKDLVNINSDLTVHSEIIKTSLLYKEMQNKEKIDASFLGLEPSDKKVQILKLISEIAAESKTLHDLDFSNNSLESIDYELVLDEIAKSSINRFKVVNHKVHGFFNHSEAYIASLARLPISILDLSVVDIIDQESVINILAKSRFLHILNLSYINVPKLSVIVDDATAEVVTNFPDQNNNNDIDVLQNPTSRLTNITWSNTTTNVLLHDKAKNYASALIKANVQRAAKKFIKCNSDTDESIVDKTTLIIFKYCKQELLFETLRELITSSQEDSINQNLVNNTDQLIREIIEGSCTYYAKHVFSAMAICKTIIQTLDTTNSDNTKTLKIADQSTILTMPDDLLYTILTFVSEDFYYFQDMKEFYSTNPMVDNYNPAEEVSAYFTPPATPTRSNSEEEGAILGADNWSDTEEDGIATFWD